MNNNDMESKKFDVVATQDIKKVAPQFAGVAICAEVVNSKYSSELWSEINELAEYIKSNFTAEEIKSKPTIDATRQVYRLCGKDPSRYRPSAEALCRRIIKGNDIYQIDTLVDLINLVSIKTGYSIGGFDADKIKGTSLSLGVGRKDEPFEGIGRGVLNIEGLPVYRDMEGGIGTPTSDNERTKITLETKRLLVLINGYSGIDGLSEAAELMCRLITEYAKGKNIVVSYY